MNRYQFMTYTLVICNVLYLVSMFIAAWWGFTYPNIVVDVYVSGKSAIVATLMCVLSCICLGGLNYQNYYLLIVYACCTILVLFNQIFNPFSVSWTRTPNYPLSGDIQTQIYILTVPKIILVVFALIMAWKMRQIELERKLSRADPRCRCGSSRSTVSRTSQRSFHPVDSQPPPPPLPPPNAIIRTPPLYPLHRPSLPINDLPINRSPQTCPLNGPLSGPPSTPPWKERRWGSVGREYGHYFRDVYNPDY